MNVTLAVLGLLITLPLMVLIAVAIKCTSVGPVFYTQTRIGLDRRRSRRSIAQAYGCRRLEDRGGRLFTMLKFRTMSVLDGASETWARPQDPRITRIGAILRRHRLDELPQFLNVIKGDMNIVGPRPEQPAIFLRLKQEVTGYAKRQRVLPGITGWAQINHRYDRCLDDVIRKTSLDLEYLRRRCMTEDIRIMTRTVPVMLRKDLAI